MADANIMVPSRPVQIITTGTTTIPNAFSATVPTTTVPANTTTDSSVVITPPGPANGIVFMPFTTNSAHTGSQVRVIGWQAFTQTVTKDAVWYMPQVLATFTLTTTSAVTKPSYTIQNETVVPYAVATLTASLLTNVTPRIYGTAAAGTEQLWLGVDTTGCSFISLQFIANANSEMGAFLRWV